MSRKKKDLLMTSLCAGSVNDCQAKESKESELSSLVNGEPLMESDQKNFAVVNKQIVVVRNNSFKVS